MCLCELFAPIRRGAYLIRRNDGRDVLYGMAVVIFFSSIFHLIFLLDSAIVLSTFFFLLFWANVLRY